MGMMLCISVLFMHAGSVGQMLSGMSIAGLEILAIEYTCAGIESSLSECLNSSLATCTNQVVAAVSCQGEVCTCTWYMGVS